MPERLRQRCRIRAYGGAGAALILAALVIVLGACRGQVAPRVTVATRGSTTGPGAAVGSSGGGAAEGLDAAPNTLPGLGGRMGTSAVVAPTASITGTVPPPGWRVYSDPAAGYSLSLPPGVDFRAGQSTAGVYTARAQFQIPGAAGYQGLVVRVEPNPQGQGLEQILNRLYQSANLQQPPADLLAQAQALTVAGLAGVKTGGPGEDFAIVVPYDDKVYYIAPVHDMAMMAVDTRTLALFNQILSTFRITK